MREQQRRLFSEGSGQEQQAQEKGVSCRVQGLAPVVPAE